MGVEQEIWRIEDGDVPKSLVTGGIDFEKRLENILETNIDLLSPGWMIIGRQCPTPFGKFVDLLAVDAYGDLVILELKRNQTPRDVVAQALEYGQWAGTLDDGDLANIFETYQEKKGLSEPLSLDEAFSQRFGRTIPGELNNSHQLVVVAARLDPESERIVEYLSESYAVPINIAFFKVFSDDGREYISRAWFAEPNVMSSEEPKSASAEAWNGETYMSFGYPPEVVNAGLKYGFVCAGGGHWYSGSLGSLEQGDRVWVNRVGGYIGVGLVASDQSTTADEFTVQVDGAAVPIADVDLGDYRLRTVADVGADMADYFVSVDWLATADFDSAVSEKGFFGNQNTVARPRAASWQHTIDRLKVRWGIS